MTGVPSVHSIVGLLSIAYAGRAGWRYRSVDGRLVVSTQFEDVAATLMNGLDGWSTATAYDARDMVSAVVTRSDGRVRKSTLGY